MPDNMALLSDSVRLSNTAAFVPAMSCWRSDGDMGRSRPSSLVCASFTKMAPEMARPKPMPDSWAWQR